MCKRMSLSPVLYLLVALLLCQCVEGNGETDTQNCRCAAESMPCAFIAPVLTNPTEAYCVGAADYRWSAGDRVEPFGLDNNSNKQDTRVRLFDPPESNGTEDLGANLSSATLQYVTEEIPFVCYEMPSDKTASDCRQSLFNRRSYSVRVFSGQPEPQCNPRHFFPCKPSSMSGPAR